MADEEVVDAPAAEEVVEEEVEMSVLDALKSVRCFLLVTGVKM
jgi:hypothetical protein